MRYLYFMGIQSYASHDSGASLIKFDTQNFKIDYVCISEERLNRIKHPYSFPYYSIQYCLDYFKLKNLSKINYLISDWIKERKWIRSGPSYNYSMFDYLKEKFKFNNKVVQIDHHLAHAASVFYTSNFKESSILIVDGLGSDLETTSFYHGSNNSIKLIDKYKEHGIGSLYGAVTTNILNFGTGGEGKTMGLAPYGEKNKGKLKFKYNLKGIKTDFGDIMKRLPLSDVLNQISDNFRPDPLKFIHKKCTNKNHLNPYFSGVSFDVQELTEKVMVHLGKELFKKTKSKNICIAGGCGLNSVANKKLFDNSKFKNIFVFPACSDSGIPFGAALWGLYNLTPKKLKSKINFKFKNAYTGMSYHEKENLKLLKKSKIKFKKTNSLEIAKLISEGKIVARCAGKSEYGPRALGNRSIFADARDKEMRDHLNIKIKHREIFRPFAPIVLEEDNKEYFDLTQNSPYMLLVAACKKPKSIPSAVHVDNTARVQTINKFQNQKVYQIVKHFKKITGTPIILNTSFNDAGEPMVETALDALICTIQTGIDYLILDNFLINKNDLNKKIYKNLINFRKKKLNAREKFIFKKLFNKISVKEFLKKKNIENKSAIFRSIYSSKEIILKFFKKNLYKKVLIIGTNDHTSIIEKYLINEGIKLFNCYYFEIPKNDFLKKKVKIDIKKIYKLNNLQKYDSIFISSFEYQSQIIEKYLKKIKKNKFFKIYDSSSRSLIDTFWINKFGKKKKIFDKGINSNF